jgi:hypothetical protein
MTKITEQLFIFYSPTTSPEDKSNALISEGWQPYGPAGYSDDQWYQTWVKYEYPQERKESTATQEPISGSDSSRYFNEN